MPTTEVIEVFNWYDPHCKECRAGAKSHLHPDGTARVLSLNREHFFHKVYKYNRNISCTCEWGTVHRDDPTAKACTHVRIALRLREEAVLARIQDIFATREERTRE